MKKFLILLPLLLAFEKTAASVCFDPFADATADNGSSYAVGEPLTHQVNAIGNEWYALTNTPVPPATGVPVIAAGNLSYPGLPASGGNSVFIPSAAGVMGRLTLGFTTTHGAVYFSFLLKVTDLSEIDSSGTQNNYFAAFGDTVGNQNATLLRAATKIYTRKSGDGFNLGVARNSNNASDWVFDTTRRNTNEVLFIVGSYDYDNHTANLWINPDSSTFHAATAPPPTVTATGGSDLNANGIRAFVLGCRTNPPPGCVVDELRVGTSWAYVTGGLMIEEQPADHNQNAGATATFSVSAVGAPPLSYQWRKDGIDLSDDENIFDATGANLSISNLIQSDEGGYSVKVTAADGSSITSSVATLTVNDPAINSQPVNQVLPAGTNAVFQIAAAGTGPLIYQWYKNGVALNDGGNVSGATSGALNIANISSSDGGTYFVQVKNGLSEVVISSNSDLYITDSSLNGSRPNIIFILADDLGYGDSGVLYQNSRAAGLPKETTPNLDSFADEGMQLRMHYCPAPICVPSRASLMLGVHQGHANVRDEQWDKAISDNHTLANVLQAAGYATAAIGKWGIGGDDVGGTTPADWTAFPTKRGFDYFFGYERHADAHEHYPKEAINSNGSKEMWDGTNDITPTLDKCYTTDLFTARAKKWLKDQHAAHPNQPVFLYLAFDTPHFYYELPTQAYPSGGGTNGGVQWLGAPGHMINTASGAVDSYIPPDYASATYDDDDNPNTPEVAWPDLYKRYATGVRRIDEAVGDIVQLLKDLNMDTNTLVVFTSDNGPTTDQGIAANFFDTFGPMDGVKRDTWEGGIRVPTFVRWPGKIVAGSISLTPSEFQDWMPTFADLAGLPAPAESDGVSLVPTLTGVGVQRPSTIYIEYDDPYSTPDYPEFEPNHRSRVRGQMQVIGLDGLQGVRYDINSQTDDFEIYDVVHDPKEATNLALNPDYADVQQEMKNRVLQLRRPNPSAPRPYDDELVPAISASPVTQGVEWSAYEEMFPWVPELTTLTPFAGGETNCPTLAVRPRDNDIGLLFTGYIVAPTNGDYTFYLSADMGALLRIHDATVIDADYGYSAGTEISGEIKLQAGLHPFRLYYARQIAAPPPELNFSWSGPGFSKQPIPESAFLRDGSGPSIPPIALDDNISTPQGAPVLINVLTNDFDESELPLTITGVGQPKAGTAVISDGQILYTPNSNFLGDDSFTYTISDGEATSTATVRVSVFLADGNYWFPFDQTSGLTTVEAGGGATASLIGFTNDPAQWILGKFNDALQFDGISNEVVINGFKGIVGTNPRTVSAWIKTSETNNSIGIVSWGDLPSGEKWSLLAQNSTEPKGTLRLELGYGNTIASTPVNDGQWHFVACTLDDSPSPNSTDVKFYVDGKLDSIAGGAPVNINTATNNDVLIGCDVQGRYFDGVIDEVCIYNRALTADEIAAQFDETAGSADAWYRRYFGDAPIDWNADDDGDGVSRLGEYAFGGEPLISDSQVAQIIPQIVNGHLQIQFHRRVAGTSELIYQLQNSSDLVNWSTLAGTEISVIPSATLPGFEDVIFRAEQAVSAESPMFVRLTAQLP